MSQWKHVESVARRKLGQPAEWTVYSLEVLGDGNFLARGAIECTRPGEKREWLDEGKAAVVTPAQLAKEQVRYEREMHKCHACLGTGKTLARWEHDKGATCACCKRCGGSGEGKA